MTIFELVKIALDELYGESQKVFGSEVDQEIKLRIDYLAASYRNLNSSTRIPIDYNDPATRFAYVFKYVAAHGDYVVQVMEELRGKFGGKIFSEDTLRISCVGGGPGSEIIAALKYLDTYKASEPVKKIICYLLDKEQAWADTWTELDESLKSNLTVNVNFQPLDVTDVSSWQAQTRFLQADLFTMSYFVSEVMSLDGSGKVSQFWEKLFANAKQGALFLYVDNGNDGFNHYFDERWKNAKLECVLKESNVRMTPRSQEQASELQMYRDKFGQSPKIQAILSYRVLRKP
ncbi:MAG: hypothetical protein QM686_17460 [Herbaspirillum sp.]